MGDAYEAVVFCSRCRKIATTKNGKLQYDEGRVVCWPDCNESPYVRALLAWADRELR